MILSAKFDLASSSDSFMSPESFWNFGGSFGLWLVGAEKHSLLDHKTRLEVWSDQTDSIAISRLIAQKVKP